MACAGIVLVVIVAVVATVSATRADSAQYAPYNASQSEEETCSDSMLCLQPSDCQEILDIVHECEGNKICCIPNVLDKINVNATRSKEYLLPEDCGNVFVGNRIAQGDNASLGQFPWMVLLGYSYPPVNITQYSCGASLINDRYVLTAAHCTKLKPFILSFARLGELNVNSKIDCELQANVEVCADPPVDIKIEKIIPHPQYNSTTLKNDIALLRLAQKVEKFTEYIQPVCLPIGMKSRGSYLTSKRLEVAGWGKVSSETIGGSSILQYAAVNGLDRKKCNSKLPPKVRPIGETQLCAAGNEQQEACRGDSGGPLIDQYSSGDGFKSYAVGIVSFKSLDTCGTEKTPNIFTKVDEYTDWIVETIEP